MSEASKRLRRDGLPLVLRDDIIAVLDELDALRLDAERYRKLRESHWSHGSDALIVTRSKSLIVGQQTYSHDCLDVEVDLMPCGPLANHGATSSNGKELL